MNSDISVVIFQMQLPSFPVTFTEFYVYFCLVFFWLLKTNTAN